MNVQANALDAFGRSLVHQPGRLVRLVRLVVLALRVRRERRQLARLSDAQLDDIGISRKDAEREAQRELFDLPDGRIDA